MGAAQVRQTKIDISLGTVTRGTASSRLKLYSPQAQGVTHYGNRAKAHRRSGNHGTQQQTKDRVEDAGCNRNAQHVIDEGEKKILLDIPHRCPTQEPRPDDSPKIPLNERDPGALHGYVCARTHGNADLRLRQGRSVVDSIARHGDETSLFLQPLYMLALILRQDFRDHAVGAELTRDGLRSGPAVTSEHYDSDVFPVQLADSLSCRGLDGIGHADDSRRPSVDGYKYDGLTFGPP